MMYEVIAAFTDLADNNHKYNVGDTYPRTGYKPTESRCDKLLSDKNRQGHPLIKVVQKATTDVMEDIPETPVEVKAEDKPKRRRRK